MAAKPYGPKFEKEQRKRWVLQRQVLGHLKKYGASNWDGLYVLFDLNRTAAIAPALQDLRECGYIEVTKDKDMMVTITASGLKRLDEKDY